MNGYILNIVFFFRYILKDCIVFGELGWKYSCFFFDTFRLGGRDFLGGIRGYRMT